MENKKATVKNIGELDSIDQLKPAPYNPRAISEESLKALGVSLEEFGDLSGFTWNKRTGNLVTGHQRLRALQDEARGDSHA
jgi:ParB-like chromosome segregation protein Spo0J